MIRQLWFGYLNGVDTAEGERWYYRYHAPEFVRWFGPWLRRYETYLALEPPVEAYERFGARRGRYTEMWWPSIEAVQEAQSGPRPRPFTPGSWEPGPERRNILTAMTYIPAHPTEEFVGPEPNNELPLVRWLRVFRYADGVSTEDGDRWYLEQHAPELAELPGLLRFTSYRTLNFRQVAESGPYGRWYRVDELWFSDLDAWRAALVDSPPRLTPPPWTDTEPFVHMYSDFVRAKPVVDFLRDRPRVP